MKRIILCCLLTLPWFNVSVARRNPMENPGMFEGDMLGVELDEDRNAVPKDSQRWPGGIVPYIVDKSLTGRHLRMLYESMDYIEERTCIRFVPRSSEIDYIRAFNGSGCFAHWGRLGIGEQRLSLGIGCDYLGTSIHELLHTIGFEHEHSRSDRDDYLTILWENIPREWYHAFKKLKPHENRLLTPFDYDSIMLYDSKAYAKNPGLVSMVKKNGEKLVDQFYKNHMTESDILRVKLLYKCPN